MAEVFNDLFRDVTWYIPVLSVGSNAAPGAPAAGDRYIVGTAPAGAWAGQANAVALWDGAAWVFTLPSASTPGWRVWLTPAASVSSTLYGWSGAAWVALISLLRQAPVSIELDAIDAVFQQVDLGAGAVPNPTPAVRGTQEVLQYPVDEDRGLPWQSYVPAGYAGGTLRVSIYWVGLPENAGNCLWGAAFERNNEGGPYDIDADSFAAVRTALSAAPAVEGEIARADIDFTQAQADGVVAGNPARLFVERVGSDGSDTLTGPAQLVRVVVQEIP